MIALRLIPTAAHDNVFARLPPDHVNQKVLAASVAETETVPADAKFVIFSADGDFFARVGAAPSSITADVADGTAGELNPLQWSVTPGQVIHVIASAARIITFSYYS